MTLDETLTLQHLIGQRIIDERHRLATEWLSRLTHILPVGVREVFPTDQLLDHVPDLLAEIGRLLPAASSPEGGSSTVVLIKAREFGRLRHGQRASVHQLLREYEILGDILDQFVVHESEQLRLNPTPQTCFACSQRIHQAIYALMQVTIDTFVSEYTATIERHTERLTNFHRVLGHELRNPLGTLQFAASLLEHDGLTPETQTRVAALIKRNVARADAVMRTLTSMTLEKEAADSPSRQLVDLEMIAREVVRQLEDAARTRDVSVRIQPGMPSVIVDAGKLELMLMNLVSNAIKYSDPRKDSRFVDLMAHLPSASELELAIRDNGLGIAAEQQDAVLRQFYRAHADLDATLGNDGSGLGLTIVQECAKELNGTVHMESQADIGTTFRIRLPIHPSDAPSSTKLG